MTLAATTADARTLDAKAVRRLMAADGYLQLGLPAAALAELDRVENAGPLESARDYLAGQALMADDRHEDALGPLQRAAEAIPAPWNRAAYECLSECFRATGHDELAEVTDLWGDDDGIPPGFDPDAAVTAETRADRAAYVADDPAEAAAEDFEAGETAWNVAEDFGDAADLSVYPNESGPTLWGGDGWGGESRETDGAPRLDDPEQAGDFGAEADAMEPGRPREWDVLSFDGGFGTDDDVDDDADDDVLPPYIR